MPKRCIPGLPKWETFAGGTMTPAKHSYRFRAPIGGYYDIAPVASENGHFRGYVVTFVAQGVTPEAKGLHNWIAADGSVSPTPRTVYRSPHKAVAACWAHAQKVGICSVPVPRVRRPKPPATPVSS